MSLELITLQRRTFEIVACRITKDNIDEIADWCGGRVGFEGNFLKNDLDDVPYKHERQFIENWETRAYVELRVLVNRNPELAKARIGDWITGGRSFKIYRDDSIASIFEPKDTEKLQKITAILQLLNYEQHEATSRGKPTSMEKFTSEMAQKIYGLG